MELNMEEIKKIEKKLEVVFEELGFEKATVNGTLFYLHCTSYYKITYVEGLKAFVIECADDYSAVEKNVFEDGDLYPISLGEDGVIDKLRYDLINYYITN